MCHLDTNSFSICFSCQDFSVRIALLNQAEFKPNGFKCVIMKCVIITLNSKGFNNLHAYMSIGKAKGIINQLNLLE